MQLLLAMADMFQLTVLPIERDSHSVSLLRGLSSREADARQDTVSQCHSLFQVWYYGLGSPPTPSESQFLDGSNHPGGDPLLRHQIEEQLPELLRLSAVAPLQDTREKASNLLGFVQDSLQMRLPRPTHLRASSFIPQSELIPLDSSLDCQRKSSGAYEDSEDSGGCVSHDLTSELIAKSQSLLLEQFHEWHRCGNVFQVMAYHPEYLEVFLHFHNMLLQGPGPIGVAERHYLAIMAAARHKCSYLVQLHALEFIHLNGDPEWLRGLSHASPKVQKLGRLCKLLAHRPWEVNSATLRSLLSGKDSFSQSEFVHALCLLSHFTALAGFVAGSGILPELDFAQGHSYRNDSGDFHGVNGSCAAPSSAPSSPGVDPRQRVQELMNVIKDLDSTPEEGLPEEQLLQRFETVELENADIEFVSSAKETALGSAEQAGTELDSFCEDPDFHYKDFHQAKADTKSRSFRIQDYSWEEDGSCLADRFLPNFGSDLNERFLRSFNLTYCTMGANENVETEPFRRAVWYYVHSIFGLRHDDYDYNLINRLLTIDLKKFCKLVACCPEKVTKSHYKAAMPGFTHSEKVHVNLVIMDSRMQASILYGLRALNNHMTDQ